MATYTEIKERHSKEFGEFPIAFAFSEKQLQEALVKLGAKKEDCVSIGSGGILQKKDTDALKNLWERHSVEMSKFYKDDKSLVSAIVYELANHEFGYTFDPADTINALGLDMDDERTKKLFHQAKIEYWEANKQYFE